MWDGLVTGINYNDQLKLSLQDCEVYCEGKQSCLTFDHSNTRSSGLLDVIVLKNPDFQRLLEKHYRK